MKDRDIVETVLCDLSTEFNVEYTIHQENFNEDILTIINADTDEVIRFYYFDGKKNFLRSK